MFSDDRPTIPLAFDPMEAWREAKTRNRAAMSAAQFEGCERPTVPVPPPSTPRRVRSRGAR